MRLYELSIITLFASFIFSCRTNPGSKTSHASEVDNRLYIEQLEVKAEAFSDSKCIPNMKYVDLEDSPYMEFAYSHTDEIDSGLNQKMPLRGFSCSSNTKFTKTKGWKFRVKDVTFLGYLEAKIKREPCL